MPVYDDLEEEARPPAAPSKRSSPERESASSGPRNPFIPVRSLYSWKPDQKDVEAALRTTESDGGSS